MIMATSKAKAISCLQQLLIKLNAVPKVGHIVIAQKLSLGTDRRLVYWTREPWYEDAED